MTKEEIIGVFNDMIDELNRSKENNQRVNLDCLIRAFQAIRAHIESDQPREEQK